MSSKNTTYLLLIIITFIGFACNTHVSNNQMQTTNTYNYYISMEKAIGLQINMPIYCNLEEVGTITKIETKNQSIVYTLELSKNDVFYYTTELFINDNHLELVNLQKSNKQIALGDTFKLEIAYFNPSSNSVYNEKSEITQEDLDSLEQKIKHLSNLINEFNGNP